MLIDAQRARALAPVDQRMAGIVVALPLAESHLLEDVRVVVELKGRAAKSTLRRMMYERRAEEHESRIIVSQDQMTVDSMDYLLKSKCTSCISSEISTSTVAWGRVCDKSGRNGNNVHISSGKWFSILGWKHIIASRDDQKRVNSKRD